MPAKSLKMVQDREQIRELIKKLSSALQMVKIYTVNHRSAQLAIAGAYGEFRQAFRNLGEVKFGVVENELFYKNHIFFDLTGQVKDFIKVLQDKKVQYLSFNQALTKEELTRFLEILSARESEVGIEFVKKYGAEFANINTGKFGSDTKTQGPMDQQEAFRQKLSNAEDIYDNSLKSLGDLLTRSLRDQQLDISLLLQVSAKICQGWVHYKDFFFTLMAVKRHDDATFAHCLHTAILTMFQAKNLGLAEEQMVRLGVAGFLHDIGKVAVKKKLLSKSEALDTTEFDRIKRHTDFGAKLLLKSPNFDKLAFMVGYQHHMGYNLEGYPKPRFLKKQHLAVRMVAISDIYDALRSRRSYKAAISLERVYEIMKKEAGRLLDPELVDLFFSNLGVWPAGTLVRLDTGEVGIVKENNPQDIFRPKVEIIYDDKQIKLKDRLLGDLTEKDDSGNFKRRIIRHISAEGEGYKFISDLYGK